MKHQVNYKKSKLLNWRWKTHQNSRSSWMILGLALRTFTVFAKRGEVVAWAWFSVKAPALSGSTQSASTSPRRISRVFSRTRNSNLYAKFANSCEQYISRTFERNQFNEKKSIKTKHCWPYQNYKCEVSEYNIKVAGLFFVDSKTFKITWLQFNLSKLDECSRFHTQQNGFSAKHLLPIRLLSLHIRFLLII